MDKVKRGNGGMMQQSCRMMEWWNGGMVKR